MPSNPAMQGLEQARPDAQPNQDAGGDLQQAAAGILQDAVSQFGPEIIQVIIQILSSGGEQGEGSGQQPPAEPSPFQ